MLRDVPGSKKAMFVVPYAGGDATAFAKFVESMSKTMPDVSIYNIDFLHSYDECKKVADLIAEIGENRELYIYSHCAGTAVALQIINILEERNINFANYIVGGYILPKKPSVKTVGIRCLIRKSNASFFRQGHRLKNSLSIRITT